jgi:biopolymer transport protein ExbB
MAVLAGAISSDGWVVIALIALLGSVSGEVAISKAMRLRRADRANNRFLEPFRGKSFDVVAPAGAKDQIALDASEWKDCPLFAVYSAGANELGKLRQDQGADQQFSSSAWKSFAPPSTPASSGRPTASTKGWCC